MMGAFAADAVTLRPFPDWSYHVVTLQVVPVQNVVSADVFKTLDANPILDVVLSLDRVTVIALPA